MSLHYRDNRLYFGETPFCIDELSSHYKAPTYVYDLEGIEKRFSLLEEQVPRLRIFFALKANSSLQILKSLLTQGSGLDVVSGGEIRLGLQAGFLPSAIIFSGVGKTRDEIRFAIQSEIKQINVESAQELQRIGQIATELQKSCSVAFRLNPDVDAKTHPYISTGFRENKFGMAEDQIPELLAILKQFPFVRLKGITVHIGSQLVDLSPLDAAFSKAKEIFYSLSYSGHALETLDVGGGVGIDYQRTHFLHQSSDYDRIKEYGSILRRQFSTFGGDLYCEPGRILVASSGILLAQVQYVKQTLHKNFLVLDTGIHHLIRPALYGAFHHILPVKIDPQASPMVYDVVGPVCESSDTLGKNRVFAGVRQDDLVVIADSGAYGHTMSSRYNEHTLPNAIFLSKGKIASQHQRESFAP